MKRQKKVSGLPGSSKRNRRILAGTLVLFFLLLVLPFAALLERVYAQLEAQTYFQYRKQAEELTSRIERRITELLQPEELRPFAEYQFFSVENAPLTQTAEIGYSALSQLPLKSNIPGIVGYFQVNPGNRFTTPLLPDASAEEIERLAKEQGAASFDLGERIRIRDKLREILHSKLLLPSTKAKTSQVVSNEEAKKRYANAVQGVFGGALPAGDGFTGGRDNSSAPAPGYAYDRKETTAGASVGAPKNETADEVEYIRATKDKVAKGDAAYDDKGSIKSGKKAEYATQLSELKLDTKYWEGQQQGPGAQAQSAPLEKSLNKFPSKLQARQSRKELVTVPTDLAADAEEERSAPKSQSQVVVSNNASALFNYLNLGSSKNLERANDSRSRELADSANKPTTQWGDPKGLPQVEWSRGQSTQKGVAQAPNVVASRRIQEEQVEVQTFESAIDPFQFELLSADCFTFYRKVWKNNQRLIQGFVANSKEFLNKVVQDQFYQDSLSSTASLIVGYKGEVHATYAQTPSVIDSMYTVSRRKSGDDNSVLLYRTSLPPPLEQVELLFTSGKIASGPEVMVVHALVGTFTIILIVGLYSFYAMGVRQLDLLQQRSDFVSAVSHELKTPLTSIRMYAEMLREGWVNDAEKQRSYYDFIFFETERLSRLIANVLQFSRLSKTGVTVELKALEVSRLLDLVKSKVDSQVQAAGFSVSFTIEGDSSRKIAADEDSFVQIVTNLVDNAIKFSGKGDKKEIVVGCRALPEKDIVFYVRDYGPGIDGKQVKKIFDLFYRGENEMTRTTPGTGIGLALVRALADCMHGQVSVENRTPGAEFSIRFPAA